MSKRTQFFATRWGIIGVGALIGVFAALLQRWGNSPTDRAMEVKKLPAHRAGLPRNENMIIGSAFLPAPAAGRRGIQPTCP